MGPKEIARMITEDPDVIEESIGAQEIYDFYAIVGSFTQEYFSDLIQEFADKVYNEFRRMLASHARAGFTGGMCGIPTEEKWISWGGSRKLYNKLLEIYRSITTIEKGDGPKPWAKCDPDGFIGFATWDDVDRHSSDIYDILSDDDISELYEIITVRKDFSFFGGGTWTKAWQDFLKYSKNLSNPDIDKQIMAIDQIMSIAHHNGDMADYVGDKIKVYDSEYEKTIFKSALTEPLNTKFNAKTVADYWDKVSPKLQTSINKARRDLQMPLIVWNQSRPDKIFSHNPREEAKTRRNIENCEPIMFYIWQLQHDAKQLGYPEDWINDKVEKGRKEGEKRGITPIANWSTKGGLDGT